MRCATRRKKKKKKIVFLFTHECVCLERIVRDYINIVLEDCGDGGGGGWTGRRWEILGRVGVVYASDCGSNNREKCVRLVGREACETTGRDGEEEWWIVRRKRAAGDKKWQSGRVPSYREPGYRVTSLAGCCTTRKCACARCSRILILYTYIFIPSALVSHGIHIYIYIYTRVFYNERIQ